MPSNSHPAPVYSSEQKLQDAGAVLLGVGRDADPLDDGCGTAAVTVTVAVRVVLPVALAAVSVYVVVAAGLTVAMVPVTIPTFGLMLRVCAFVVVQLSVVAAPASIVPGVAENELIAGAGAGGVLPPLLSR
jgi:hypothetical protein